MAANFLSPLAMFGTTHAALGSDLVTVIATDRGWYNSDGQPDDGNPGDPLANYAAGFLLNQEFRNWFVFDLSSIEGEITEVTIHLAVPPPLDGAPPAISGGYRREDPFEIFELRSVESSIDAIMNAAGGLIAYQDLGAGDLYGSAVMTEAQEGQSVQIPLSAAAIASANQAILLDGGLWALGGRVTSLNGLGQQGIFAGSHGMPAESAFLTITVVPAQGAMMIFAVAGLLRSRRNREAKQMRD